MARKYMKRHSISLAIKEMQMKSTMCYYFISTRMATIKDNNKDVKILESSYTTPGNVKWCSHCGKCLTVSHIEKLQYPR